MQRSDSKLAKELAALRDLSRDELAIRWERTYGSAPPKGVRRELMIRSAAWHVQAKHLGGLSAGTRRLLKSSIAAVETKQLDLRTKRNPTGDDGRPPSSREAAADALPAIDDPQTPRRQRRTVLPGARLLRDWNGRTHVVDVIEDGYVFEAKVYPSLTAIAKMITGAHWSGPRFFGL